MADEEILRTRFEVFIELINKRPMLWTIGLMLPTYASAFALAFVGLLMDPHLRSPLPTFILLAIAALIVMTYHWLFSRFQYASPLAQVIQFFAGLIPLIGGLIILLISRLAVG